MSEKTIWDYLYKDIQNAYGVAGLMGNIYAESGMIPNRVEALCLRRLSEIGQNWTDKTYTAAIDSNKLSKEDFLHPLPGKQYGYGLCQWTSPGRKEGLYNLAKSKNKSIGNETIQLEWLLKELKQSYPIVYNTIKNADNIKIASDVVLLRFECPADTGVTVREKRANYGKQYYDKYNINKEVKTMSNYDKYILSTSTHYISNSGSDEHGAYHGGKAGDQTGKEWYLRTWYNRPWDCVLRYEKNPQVGLKIAELACAAALNNNIGYDQYERETYWKYLKLAGYNPSLITTPCEADCSAGVIANTKAAGYLLGIPALQNISATYTGNMKAAFKAAGFTVLTGTQYTKTTVNLLPGDILLNERSHTATNITRGKNTYTSAPSKGNTKYVNTGIGTATALTEMNVRSGNSTQYPVLKTISAGTQVEVLEKTSNNWYKISWPGASVGYAYTSAEKNTYYKYVSKKTNSTTTTVKKKVTAKGVASSFKRSYAGTYKVATNSGTLNVRDGANTNKDVLVAIPKGTIVQNYGYYSKTNGTIWLYVQFDYKNVTYTGFASKAYLAKC